MGKASFAPIDMFLKDAGEGIVSSFSMSQFL